MEYVQDDRKGKYNKKRDININKETDNWKRGYI